MPGTADKADELRAERDLILLEREVANLRRVEAARRLVESRVIAPDRPVIEAWGEAIDRFEYLRDTGYDDRPASPISTIGDRTEGQLRGTFETETELGAIRGQARLLHLITSNAICPFENLTNYTFGTGFSYTVQDRKGGAAVDGLSEAVQQIVDDFLEHNSWIGDRERELHVRTRRDGETFNCLKLRDGHVVHRFIEPENVSEPLNAREFNDWIDVGVPASWKFGVHTEFKDTETVFGYHVRWDETGANFDYFPEKSIALAHRLGTGLVHHIKVNVDATIKRGISDLYAVKQHVKSETQLTRNMGVGAAVQAAIAWIEEYATGTPQSQVDATIVSGAQDFFDKPLRSGGQERTYVNEHDAGTILHTPAGKQYKPGPMGTQRNPDFVLVGQHILRALGRRWCMPEYMISGDASNANFASTLVAESPFVKARHADQHFYKSRIAGLLWKVIRIAAAAGYLDKFRGAIDLSRLERHLELAIEAPDPASRDPKVVAEVAKIYREMGIQSDRTTAAHADLDFDQERENQEQDGDKPTPQAPGIPPIPGLTTMGPGQPFFGPRPPQPPQPQEDSGGTDEPPPTPESGDRSNLTNHIVDRVITKLWESYP